MEILFDTHTHTTISDGANTPEEMLTSAAQKGFEFIALTDHFDIHSQFPQELSKFDGAGRESSYNLLVGLKRRDFGVKFLNGIEIAQAHQYPAIAESWLSSHEYDYVIASCHIIRGHIDFYHTDYSKNTPAMMLAQYFDELVELCSWGGEDRKFDALAHLTYPLRYMKGVIDMGWYKTVIDELFRIMIKYETALEINTAGFILSPELLQIERYYNLGGRLITIGSDAHSSDSLAQKINTGIRVAKLVGFDECVYYEEREPRFIKI
jgi:histidinol-phosphatase (PHP family)